MIEILSSILEEVKGLRRDIQEVNEQKKRKTNPGEFDDTESSRKGKEHKVMNESG